MISAPEMQSKAVPCVVEVLHSHSLGAGWPPKPPRAGFPIRPPLNQDPKTPDEEFAAETPRRMNEVLARIQELEDALDDPARLWPRLRDAWKRAENEADPRMAEMVRQAREIDPVLKDLEHRIRRVLRRTRELTPLKRVQEMDRASMLRLSRQPGRTIAERGGPAQRILSTVRHDNFDTLENRVFHAYVRLAALVAREWQREHRRAQGSDRFRCAIAVGACIASWSLGYSLARSGSDTT